ncbi:MAG: hypothetical protein PHH14_03090 [Candidatus Margulisbacteria bacterium]|nr:hypothetical protein [Candidatus Margulisiibacteriota bacterium]
MVISAAHLYREGNYFQAARLIRDMSYLGKCSQAEVGRLRHELRTRIFSLTVNVRGYIDYCQQFSTEGETVPDSILTLTRKGPQANDGGKTAALADTYTINYLLDGIADLTHSDELNVFTKLYDSLKYAHRSIGKILEEAKRIDYPTDDILHMNLIVISEKLGHLLI